MPAAGKNARKPVKIAQSRSAKQGFGEVHNSVSKQTLARGPKTSSSSRAVLPEPWTSVATSVKGPKAIARPAARNQAVARLALGGRPRTSKNSAWLRTAVTLSLRNGLEIRKVGSGQVPVRRQRRRLRSFGCPYRPAQTAANRANSQLLPRRRSKDFPPPCHSLESPTSLPGDGSTSREHLSLHRVEMEQP
jgi:hypothetical protein